MLLPRQQYSRELKIARDARDRVRKRVSRSGPHVGGQSQTAGDLERRLASQR